MELKETLRRIRKQRKITQVQAAQAAGVSEAMYQFYEYGKNEPTASVLIALAECFDVSLDYLLGNGVYGKLADNPEVKPALAHEIDQLLGAGTLARMNLDSTASLSDSDFCQLAASLVKDFSFNERTLEIHWKI